MRQETHPNELFSEKQYQNMKRILFVLCIGSLFINFTSASNSINSKETEDSFTIDSEIQRIIDSPLKKEYCEMVTDSLFKIFQQELKAKYGDEWANKKLLYKDLSMPFDIRIFGQKPADGRRLFISMHGGGNAPAAVNDQQYLNQIQLYQPEEGIYIAPRAPFNDWNMWFRPEMDIFFDRLIQLAVIELDVNPNKVYLMGYSAGGDGVYRMAPRMADRWAAAAMMAGHPGDVSPLNLRNIGFTLWVGENDNGYDRNKMAADFAAKLDDAKKQDPKGYTYQVHIVKGKGHWMDLEDKAAIPWMSQFVRNPLPEKIAWRQEESEAFSTSFYWLGIDEKDAQKGYTAVVNRNGNTFTIEKCDYSKLTFFFNDKMINFDEPVKITFDGKELFNAKVQRNLKTIYKTLKLRGDKNFIFSSEVTVNLN